MTTLKQAGQESVPGYSAEEELVTKRLRRSEGQVRGILRMVEDDRYCSDVCARCVTNAVQAGGEAAEQKLADASAAIARLGRS
jgi:DNA-binding FrmR family transcriptional regulator